MPGGLLQITNYGQSNIILTGNPDKTFFNAVFKAYTPFGLQRFRIDSNKKDSLRYNFPTECNFKIPRHADLLWDTTIVVNLPDIYSPLYKVNDDIKSAVNVDYLPYEFQWTTELGFAMIKEITIMAGGNILSKYSGEYMANLIHRDESNKKNLINKMIGNVPELYDPKKYNGGNYPNSVINIKEPTTPANANANANNDNPLHNNGDDIQPSIKGRKLYIPLMAWFCNSTKNALPLIALQYQEINIKIEFRPIKELFTIIKIDENDKENLPTQPFYDENIICIEGGSVKYKTINNNYRRQSTMADPLYKFLQKPPMIDNLDSEDSYIKKYEWEDDIHLIGTYIFLDNDERNILASKKHKILIKSCYEWDFKDITGSRRIKIPSKDMVSSYMWRFRRDDVNIRNQWHNYQNFAWENVSPRDPSSIINIKDEIALPEDSATGTTPGTVSRNDNIYNLHYAPKMDTVHLKNIMSDMAILCGDDYREKTLDSGIYEYIENWYRSTGSSKDGLYSYNFCINSNRLAYQPTGAQNTNKWQNVIFEFNTITPPKIDDGDEIEISILCEEDTILGVRKREGDLYKYNYDLRVFEERYNMIEILGGNITLMLAR